MSIKEKSFCPACGYGDCYNSGFTIECWNKLCNFFSQKQWEIVTKEIDKDKESKAVKPLADYTPDSLKIFHLNKRSDSTGISTNKITYLNDDDSDDDDDDSDDEVLWDLYDYYAEENQR